MNENLQNAFFNMTHYNNEVLEELIEAQESDDTELADELHKRFVLNLISIVIIIDPLFPELSNQYKINIDKLVKFNEDEIERAYGLQSDAVELLNKAFE